MKKKEIQVDGLDYQNHSNNSFINLRKSLEEL